MEKKCPHCGSPLPEEASFCPHCAKSIIPHVEQKPPRHIPAKYLRILLILCLLAAAALLFLWLNRPQKLDVTGTAEYQDEDGSYQIVSNVSNDPYRQMTEVNQYAGDEERYRFPLRLYILEKDSGADASGVFLQKVRSASISVEQADGSARSVTATDPASEKESFPKAALVSYIDFTRESPAKSDIIWQLNMENGDQIRIHFGINITPVHTYDYSTENADLSDAKALQALIDQIAADTSIKKQDTVNINLPAVTYTEPITLHDRAFSLNGQEVNGQRTVFSAGIQMRLAENDDSISYFTDLDFIGDGSGIALSTANRAWTKNCRFVNWKKAILAFGNVWVNTWDSSFENNEIGLHYNATEGSPVDTRFTGNTFRNNQTAVLLENVPTDTKMDFSDCVFSQNGADIDNRCSQPIDISKAVFE